jgi:FdhE protein
LKEQRTFEILKQERSRQPELADTLDFYLAILEAQRAVAFDGQFRLDPERSKGHAQAGEPQLRAMELAYDWARLGDLAQEICDIAGHMQPGEAIEFSNIAALFRNDPKLTRGLVIDHLSSTRHPVLSAADPQPSPRNLPPLYQDSPLLSFVLNLALHPLLSGYATEYEYFFDNAAWYRPFCPVCGGMPDFAAFGRDSGVRRLLCARCDFEWAFHRLVCPYCTSADNMGYFPMGTMGYRLYTCDGCRRYLKTIDLREFAREVDLPAERILTIGLDVAAVSAGYAVD